MILTVARETNYVTRDELTGQELQIARLARDAQAIQHDPSGPERILQRLCCTSTAQTAQIA
jgi:hypothetical protein